VPAEEITREFERGDTAEEICARSIRALRDLGVKRVYVSNLGYGRAAARMRSLNTPGGSETLRRARSKAAVAPSPSR
jgi:hypothetical protein